MLQPVIERITNEVFSIGGAALIVVGVCWLCSVYAAQACMQSALGAANMDGLPVDMPP